ncbi:peptidase E [Paenibacillus glacialis]|uniref:Peptidase E n=1 Tax=Paenibacillus glacialis TaxID=494026 RepID=A0A168LSW8_9BACL|nr:peptidase E [Paenibacillus glacialis]OAB43790.1 hypothetical protein PGLA_08410 [Paenibacillus glacialis]
MGIIVAIGGGELSLHETYAIDSEIVKLTGKEKPTALFIPTASGDAPGYCDTFQQIYGDELNCDVDFLLLIDNKMTREEIAHKVSQADLIYVGGGHTGNMLAIWREYQVDRMLLEAYNNGTVLSGLSAGSICWFEHGHSDISIPGSNDNWEYIKLEALGMLKGFHCPHFNEDARPMSFPEMIQGTDDMGIAIENYCAIIYNDNQYKVIKTADDANAYKVFCRNNHVVKEEIVQDERFRDIAELYDTK